MQVLKLGSFKLVLSLKGKLQPLFEGVQFLQPAYLSVNDTHINLIGHSLFHHYLWVKTEFSTETPEDSKAIDSLCSFDFAQVASISFWLRNLKLNMFV